MRHGPNTRAHTAHTHTGNATSGGSVEQIRMLVQAGAVRPLCDLLTCSDVRIVTVALEGLENILRVRMCVCVCACVCVRVVCAS